MTFPRITARSVLIFLAVIWCDAAAQVAEKDEFYSNDLEKHLLKNPSNKAENLLAFTAYDPKLDSSQYFLIRNLIDQLAASIQNKRKQYYNTKKFIHFAYRKTQKLYLEQYVKYIPFNEIFTSKKFNCLTGTALYSHLFTRLGFEVEIFETHFHSFLIIKEKNTYVALVDAANQASGYVTGKQKIEAAILAYQKHESEIIPEVNMFPVNHYPKIKLIAQIELAGLQYYNLAVINFNNSNMIEAANNLKKASVLYPTSERINDLLMYIDVQSQKSKSLSYSSK